MQESFKPGPETQDDAQEDASTGVREDSAPVPESIGDFEVLAELRRDATSALYRVRNPKDEGDLLLCAMSVRWALREGAKARFQELASQSRRVAHGGITPVLEIGESEGMPWFTMPTSQGMTLQEILHAMDEQQISPSLAGARCVGEILVGHRIDAEFEETWGGDWFDLIADIVTQAAKALHHAHGQGLFHGDPCPSNLHVAPDGRVRLSDFGLSRIEASAVYQATGKYAGTPSYLSPEQVAWEPECAASEVWGLGVLLYRLGTGRLPFPGATPERVFEAIRNKEPKLPWKQNPRFPKELGKITMQCLRKDPAARYASMAELAEDLDRFLDEEPVKARWPGPLARSARWVLAHPLQALPALLALILIAVVGLMETGSPAQEQTSRSRGGDRRPGSAEQAVSDRIAAERDQARNLAEVIANLIRRVRRPRGQLRVLFVGIDDQAGLGRQATAELIERLSFPGTVEVVRPRQTRRFLALAGLEFDDLTSPAGMQVLAGSLGLPFHAVLQATVTRDEGSRAQLHLELREVGTNRIDKDGLYLDGKPRPAKGLGVRISAALQGLYDAWPPLTSRAGVAFTGFTHSSSRVIQHADQLLETSLLACEPLQLITASATQRAARLAHIDPDDLTTREGGIALAQQLGVSLDYVLRGRLGAESGAVELTLHEIATGKQVASFTAR